MSASIATLLYAAVIAGLFWLDRDKARTSFALWIPIIWLSLAGSRSASEWLQSARPGASSEALLEGDPLNRAVYSGLLALGLLVLLFRGAKVARVLQTNGAIVLFLLYCALSLTWAEYPDVGFKRLAKAVGDFVMILIVVSDREPTVAIRRFLIRPGFLLIPLSVLMIKYYPDLARYYDRWDWTTYYSGVATNKNALGAICLLFGLASAWQFLAALSGRQRTGRVRRLIAHGTILAMVAWLFWLARSMTALACFLLALCLLVALELRRASHPGDPNAQSVLVNRMMLHTLVAISIIVPSVVLFIGIEPVLRMLGRSPTLTDRTLVWDLLLDQTSNPLFGTGFENFWLGSRLERIWSVYSWAPNQAHNGYLETYLNLGWVGVALLALVLASGYRTVMIATRRFPSPGTLMLAYFVVGVVYNFTEAALFRMVTPVWIVLLLAITRIPASETARQQRLSGRAIQRAIRGPASGDPATVVSRQA